MRKFTKNLLTYLIFFSLLPAFAVSINEGGTYLINSPDVYGYYGDDVTKITVDFAFAMAFGAGLPEIETGEILDLTATEALILGNVTGSGGLTIIERGVVYSTSPGPTLETGTVVQAGTAETGEFNVSISGLAPNTKYYVCAYAENGDGVSFGEYRSFTTPVSVTMVPVGSLPYAFALNQTTNKIYVPNNVGNTVSVIDGVSDTVSDTVAVGRGPYGIAVNETTNKIYVTNNTDTTVSVISGVTDSVEGTVTVGSAPRAVAVNAATNKIYVTNYMASSVSVIDGATNTVTETVTVGSRPTAVAVNEVTNKIYVANYFDDTVSVINGVTDTVDTTVTVGDSPRYCLVVNETTNKVYVVNYRGPSVTVINGLDNGTATVTLETEAYPHAAAVNESTNKIYVTNEGTNTVTIIDGDDNSTMTIDAGESPQAVAVNETTNMVYVGNYNSDDRSEAGYIVTKIDGNTNAIVGFADTSHPVEIGINETTNKTYVINQVVEDSVMVIEDYLPDYVCEILGGGGQYETLDEALSAVLDGETIRPLKDIDHTGGITIEDMSISFDLNGFDLNIENVSGAGLDLKNIGALALIGKGSLNLK